MMILKDKIKPNILSIMSKIISFPLAVCIGVLGLIVMGLEKIVDDIEWWLNKAMRK